jgi:hypothetical protein
MGIKAKFTEHPASVGETYGEHFKVATHFSLELAKASIAAALHAIYPCACTTRASDKVKSLHAEMTTGSRNDGSAAQELVTKAQAAPDNPIATTAS